MHDTPIAFLGLGIMGSGMAGQLVAKGFPVTVYNRNPDKAAQLVTQGASLAATPREAAAGAKIIFSMVADDAASRTLWLGQEGALAGAAFGTVLVESSTLTVGWVKELADHAQARSCVLLDAPVTGSKAQAAAGELNFMVGGPEEALMRAQVALAAMGRKIIHLGPTGSGAMLKLINNFLCGVQVASLAEALALVEKSGLNRDQSLELLTGGAAGSPLVKTVSARMTSQDYVPNFLLRLMAKDLAYALQEGQRHQLSYDLAAAALQVFQQGMASGQGEDDIAAVIEQFRQH